MLCYSKQPNPTDRFQIPFGPASTWNEIVVYYPNIIEEMNGESQENCLLFYYDLNPVNKIYSFKDEDLENDFADILGIDLHTVSTGESKDEESERNKCESSEDTQERLMSLEMFMNSLSDEQPIIKKKKKHNKLTDEEIDKLKEAGISIPEYIKMTNEDSVRSDITMDDAIDGEKKTKREKTGGTKSEFKLAKKERRKLLIQQRGTH